MIPQPTSSHLVEKKYIEAREDSSITLQYSAIKNRENDIPGYSVAQPPTNSDSASTKSNGDRVVSVIILSK